VKILGGWVEFCALRDIPIVLDDLDRPAVAREVLGSLIAEHRRLQAEQLARSTERVAVGEVRIPAGVPAIEDGSALESMMLAPGFVTAAEEFGDGRMSPTQEFLDERLEEGRRGGPISVRRPGDTEDAGRPRREGAVEGGARRRDLRRWRRQVGPMNVTCTTPLADVRSWVS
jgi:hypothetical protein